MEKKAILSGATGTATRTEVASAGNGKTAASKSPSADPDKAPAEVSRESDEDESALAELCARKTCDRELTVDEVVALLTTTTSENENTVAPFRPGSGTILVFGAGVDRATRRADQYHWFADGAKCIPRSNPVVKKHYFYVRGTDGCKTKLFRKHEYDMLLRNEEEEPGGRRILVQYLGDSSKAQRVRFHGNTKTERNPYTRSFGTVKENITAHGLHENPAQVYRKLVVSSTCSADVEAAAKPRNIKQVKNVLQSAKKRFRISHDALWNCVELANQFPDFVHKIVVVPDLLIYLASEQMLAELQRMIDQVAICADTPMAQLQYDTTFKLGDFYLSVLSFRHALFENSPIIPAAFLLHERKFKSDHDQFMQFVTKKCKSLQKRPFCLVTDGEFEFKEIFPTASVLHCWNHIRTSARAWLKQNNATSDDLRVYADHILRMLSCETEEDFETTSSTLSQNWSQGFKQYFEQQVKPNVVSHAGRWIVEPTGHYNPYSGITTNACESLNRVLHELAGWKERPVDAMLISLRFLQGYYEREITRGIHGIGNFVLLKKFQAFQQPSEMLPAADDLISPENIVQYVKTGIVLDADAPVRANTVTRQKDDTVSNARLSQQALAKEAVDQGRVVFVQELKSFMVEGSQHQKYAVTLFPTSCQCASTNTCYHIMAAQRLIGMPISSSIEVRNLTTLRKRKLPKKQKKSGRKQPRIGDYEITPAPDADNLQWADVPPELEPQAPRPTSKPVTTSDDDGFVCPANTEVIKLNDAHVVIVNRTLHPASPVIAVYVTDDHQASDKQTFAKAAKYATPNAFCKSVTVEAIVLAKKLSARAVANALAKDTTLLKVKRKQQHIVDIICICRSPCLGDDECDPEILMCQSKTSHVRCYKSYHKSCILTPPGEQSVAIETWECPQCCAPQHLPKWGSTQSIKASNTCPFDHFLAISYIHLLEHPTLLPVVGRTRAGKVLANVIDLLRQAKPDDAKDRWISFLTSENEVPTTTEGAFNFHGSEFDNFIKHFRYSWVAIEKSKCQSEKCPNRTTIRMLSDFSAACSDDIEQFALSFKKGRSTRCDSGFSTAPSAQTPFWISSSQDKDTGQISSTFCCASSRSVEPLQFRDSAAVWALPFSIGGLCSTLEAIDFPHSIEINGARFMLRAITLHSKSADHFVALVKWKGCWFLYDGLRHDRFTWYDVKEMPPNRFQPNFIIYMPY